eukprot:UN28159
MDRNRSPVPSYEKDLHGDMRKRELLYSNMGPSSMSKTKNFVTEPEMRNGILIPPRYGPPGQERNMHALNPKDSRSKSRCKYFMDGKCMKVNCPFLHDNIQLYLKPPNGSWRPLPTEEYERKYMVKPPTIIKHDALHEEEEEQDREGYPEEEYFFCIAR